MSAFDASRGLAEIIIHEASGAFRRPIRDLPYLLMMSSHRLFHDPDLHGASARPFAR